ncbi:MAG: vWA domain-containing protein [Vicinamibacterales bacterium]
MTFAALTSLYAWLLLMAAAALAAALFFIKLRPPRILIPSLSLWQRVLDSSTEMSLWERIRRMVSLAVTVAIAVALALSVVRPSRIGGAVTAGRGRTLIVLDSSWSMRAKTNAGDTRWDRALAEARRIAASSDQVAIATTADGLVQGLTDDSVLVESALGGLSPSAFGDTSWPTVSGVESVHFITDGAVPHHLDPSIIIHSVFESVSNVAITAFEARPSLAAVRRGPDSQVGTAYLEIANFASKRQTVHITIFRGTAKIADTRTDLGMGEAYRQILPLPRQGDAALHAHVDAPDNALDVDDDGYAWIARARPLSVVVVGDHTEWLKRLLTGDPDIRATFVAPTAYRNSREDVTIFDRWAPSTLPPQPALYVAPPDDTPWLAAGDDGTAKEERRPRWESAADHDVLRGVDPLTLRIDRARSCESSVVTPVARSSRGTPLVCVGEAPDRRIVVIGFGPSDSNLPTAPAFPVLVANAIEWLGRPENRDLSLRPGLTTFRGPARIIRDDGESVPLTHLTTSAFGVLSAPGLYTIESAGARNTIAVNAADPQRSNVARTTLASTTTAAAPRNPLERPWWLACAVAAFGLAFAEWWTWQRRLTV